MGTKNTKHGHILRFFGFLAKVCVNLEFEEMTKKPQNIATELT